MPDSLKSRFLAWRGRRDARWLVRWQAAREKGMLRFLLLWGVAGWALPILLLAGAAAAYFTPEPQLAFVSVVFLFCIPVIILGGLVYGYKVWQAFEREYLRLRSSSN